MLWCPVVKYVVKYAANPCRSSQSKFLVLEVALYHFVHCVAKPHAKKPLRGRTHGETNDLLNRLSNQNIDHLYVLLAEKKIGGGFSNSREDKRLYQSKGVGSLEASLLGGNPYDHLHHLIDGMLQALQGYVNLGVGLRM